MENIMLIVKYANRKLYSPELSRYVNLGQLREFNSFHVVEHETGIDITKLIEAKIEVYEAERILKTKHILNNLAKIQ